MSVLHEMLEANERYASSFELADLPRPPVRKVAIITCLDARIMPAQALGLEPGDANVIRNAGGRAADAIRSLVISTRLLGTRDIVVIHHNDCGLLTFSNDQIRDRIAADLGETAAEAARAIDFLAFTDLEASVREDVAFLRASPLIADDVVVHGLIYDVHTGRLTPVE
ncbi:MAG: carbonic anhydrase [Thermomicrobiales bacterium]|nr:carbonic anhydrase [Thermomicrobiales bacterium]